jgi:calcineurin-like phosphoesterase family protein
MRRDNMFKKLISAIFKKQEIEPSDFVGEKFHELVETYEKIEKDIEKVILSHEVEKMSKEDLMKFDTTVEKSITELQGSLSFCKLGLKNRSKTVLMKDWRDNIRETKKAIRNLMYYRKCIRTMIKYG